jgi:hypothetical protein
MALRLATKRLLAPQAHRLLVTRAMSAAPATSDAPSVFDNLINLTIVDPSGARRKIPGLVGKSDFGT